MNMPTTLEIFFSNHFLFHAGELVEFRQNEVFVNELIWQIDFWVLFRALANHEQPLQADLFENILTGGLTPVHL